METGFILLIFLTWLVGTCLRVYRQARFYQIEEYMSRRYLRWCLAQRERWLPRRPIIAWLAGVILGLILSEAPGSVLLTIIGVITAVVAVWPPDEGEIKKPFRATPRAKRLLGASFVVTLFDLSLYAFILSHLPLPQIPPLQFAIFSFVGLFLFLTAPLMLVFGNWLMTPVEAFFRRQFLRHAQSVLNDLNPLVIGITGSYGKTTTKTILAHILNGRYKTYPTPKSYNTLMGISMAINNDLANDHSIEVFICEMGAYIPGEIERICDLTHPTISIVVEVGPQHLERFGSLENTATAKYEIIKALPPDGVGIFNWDNPYIRQMIERGYPQNRISVSRVVDPANVPANGPRFIATDIAESLEGLRFIVHDLQTEEQEPFETPLLGEHNVTNILLATATAVHEKMSLKEIARRVKTLQPAESRLVRQTTAQGITIINDAYSANPVGAVSALKALSLFQTGRRLLITPGMVELGTMQDSENRKLGEIAAKQATDVILVGAKQTEPIKAGLLAAGFPDDHLRVVDTLAESIQWYQTNLTSGDTVLFLNDLPDTYSH